MNKEQLDAYKEMDLDILTQKKIEAMAELKALNRLINNHEMKNLHNRLASLRVQIEVEEERLKVLVGIDVDKIRSASRALEDIIFDERY